MVSTPGPTGNLECFSRLNYDSGPSNLILRNLEESNVCINQDFRPDSTAKSGANIPLPLTSSTLGSF